MNHWGPWITKEKYYYILKHYMNEKTTVRRLNTLNLFIFNDQFKHSFSQNLFVDIMNVSDISEYILMQGARHVMHRSEHLYFTNTNYKITQSSCFLRWLVVKWNDVDGNERKKKTKKGTLRKCKSQCLFFHIIKT